VCKRNGAICCDDDCCLVEDFARDLFFVGAVIYDGFVTGSSVYLREPLVDEHWWYHNERLG